MRNFGLTFSKSLRRLRKSGAVTQERAPSTIGIIEEEDETSMFNNLCSRLGEGDEESWEEVRVWMRTHDEDQVREAVLMVGDNGMTALHYICRSDPPIDVALPIIELGRDALAFPDHFEWLPIHYACACSAFPEVINAMLDEYPEGKTTVDSKGRAPLHFALSNVNPTRPMTAEIVESLVSTGAATYPDDNGMLVSS